jgi:hypothetical protein
MEQKYSYYKKQSINRFDLYQCKTNNSQDILKNHFLDSYPIHYTDDTSDYTQVKIYQGQSKYVWLVDKSVTVLNTFPWWFRPPTTAIETVFRFPYVYKTSRRIKDWHKVQLVSTDITKVRVSKQRYICGEYDPHSGKDYFDMFYLQEKETLTRYNELKPRYPNLQLVTTIEEAIQNTTTGMFWLIPDDVVVSQGFHFDYEPDEWSYNYCHMFQNGNKKNYNGIVLMPKTYEPTSRELAYRHYASKKLVAELASSPEPYDLFCIDSYEDLLTAQQTTETNMFWVVRSELSLEGVYSFEYKVSKWDEQYVHVFLNGQYYDGVALIPKNRSVSKKEFENRCYLEQKEIDLTLSNHDPYTVHCADTYEEYLELINTADRDMIWITRSDIDVNTDFNFKLQIPTWDKKYVHVFLNGTDYTGVALYPTDLPVSRKEFEHRFPIERKEWNIVASTPKLYDKFYVDTYDNYLKSLEMSSTELCWIIPSDVVVADDFKFDIFFTYGNEYDRNINHVFLNGDLYNGIMLMSKHTLISRKEFEQRFPIERKEWNIVASTPKLYDKFYVDTYDQYLKSLEISSTELCWIIPSDVVVADDFKFDIFFTYDNEYDRNINHVFLNGDLYNGIMLMSKHTLISRKEFEQRFPIERKEWNIVASTPKPYAIYK